MGAVIAAEQTGSDADQMGLSFYTHSSTNTGSNLKRQLLLIIVDILVLELKL